MRVKRYHSGSKERDGENTPSVTPTIENQSRPRSLRIYGDIIKQRDEMERSRKSLRETPIATPLWK